jgi:hypothetical protein
VSQPRSSTGGALALPLSVARSFQARRAGLRSAPRIIEGRQCGRKVAAGDHREAPLSSSKRHRQVVALKAKLDWEPFRPGKEGVPSEIGCDHRWPECVFARPVVDVNPLTSHAEAQSQMGRDIVTPSGDIARNVARGRNHPSVEGSEICTCGGKPTRDLHAARVLAWCVGGDRLGLGQRSRMYRRRFNTDPLTPVES